MHNTIKNVPHQRIIKAVLKENDRPKPERFVNRILTTQKNIIYQTMVRVPLMVCQSFFNPLAPECSFKF
jgi:hypothetical protein